MCICTHCLHTHSPKPQELGQDGPDESVDEDVGPDQSTWDLEELEAGVVKEEEARPKQQNIKKAHEPWEYICIQRKIQNQC